MPDRCVVYGCSETANPKNGIGLHKIRFFGNDRPECVRRRKRWVGFVLCRQAHWEPSKHAKICSLHLRREDFCQMFTALSGQEKPTLPRLKVDDLGTCTFPTIQANNPEFGKINPSPATMSKRTRRMVRFEVKRKS